MEPAVVEKKQYTYEDYLKTPDDKRYELIEGELLRTPSPVTKHQRISRELEFEILKFVKANNLGSVLNKRSMRPCSPRRIRLSAENKFRATKEF